MPYSFARDLFQMEDKISQLEIRVKEGTDIDQLQKKIEKIIGSDFKVKNQYQQHEAIYKVMKSEKWFIVLRKPVTIRCNTGVWDGVVCCSRRFHWAYGTTLAV